MKTKLPINGDEQEALLSLLSNSDGWKVLLKVMDALVDDQERAVLRLIVEGDATNLVHAKLRAEGARKLLNSCLDLKETYRKKTAAK